MRLGSHCEKIGSGATPRGGKSTYLEYGPFSLIRSQNVLDNAFTFGGLAYISLEQAEALSNVEVLHGDVLVNITGDSVARVCQVHADALPARVNQHVAIIRPRPNEINPRFLKYWLVSPQTKAHLLTLAGTGATRNALTKSMLEGLMLPSLPINQQDAIAETLGAVDDKIEANRRMNGTLEAMARAVFQDWFVDFGPTRRQLAGASDPHAILGGLIEDANEAHRLAPLFPARLAENGLPEGWEERLIGEVSKIVGGATPSTKNDDFWVGGTHLWATPKDLSNFQGLFISVTDRQITDAGLSKISSGASPAGSVLLSSRAPIGYLAIADAPVAVNQGFIVMQPTKAFPTAFAYFWCLENMDIIKGNANGSTFQEISKKNFRPLPVNMPSPAILEAFTALTAGLLDLVRVREGENRTLAATRDLLLPKLMSGKIRLATVKSAAAVKEAQSEPIFATDLFGDEYLSPEQEEERDAVIVAATVGALRKDDLLVGNVRVMKGSYLIKRKLGLSVGQFERQAAGPYDRVLNHEVRSYARDRSWIRETVRHSNGHRIPGNRPANNFSQIGPLVEKYRLADAVEWLSEHFKGATRDWMECVATVDVAMQELTQRGQSISVKAIKADIASDPEWRPKLSKPHFVDAEINRAIRHLQKIFAE